LAGISDVWFLLEEMVCNFCEMILDQSPNEFGFCKVTFRFPSQALPRSGSKRVFLSRIFGKPKTLGTPNGYLLSYGIQIF